MFILCLMTGTLVGGDDVNEKLVNADFDDVNDSRGFTWDIESGGVVDDGSDDAFDNGFYLKINGNGIDYSKEQMTPGGDEYVLSGISKNKKFKVTRRVQVLKQRGAIRYVETLQSNSGESENCKLLVRTRLGSSAARFITSRGQNGKNGLKSGDRGLAAVSSGRRPSVLFLLAGTDVDVRPSVKIDDKRTVDVTYQFTVPADKKVSIVHLGMQRKRNNLQSKEDIKKILKPFFKYNRLKIDLPRDLMRTVGNIDLQGEILGVPPEKRILAPLKKFLNNRKVDRKEETDQLILADDSKVSGTVTWNSLEVNMDVAGASVNTSFSPEEVAVIQGSAGGRQEPAVYLRNGEVYRGAVTSDGLKIEGEQGLVIPLSPADVDLMVMRTSERDGTPPKKAELLLTTHSGTRLALNYREESNQMTARTPFGELKLSPDSLRMLVFKRDPQPVYHLYLTNGSHLPSMIMEDRLSVEHRRFGSIEIDTGDLASLTHFNFVRSTSDNGENKNEENKAPTGAERYPHLILDGDFVLAGKIRFDKLQLTSTSGNVSMDPDQIQRFERVSDVSRPGERPKFKVTLSESSHVNGTFQKLFVPVDIAGQTLSVPQHMIELFSRPQNNGEHKSNE